MQQTGEFFNNDLVIKDYTNLNSNPTGEVLTYAEVQTFHDGSAMSDSLLDGYVYRKKDSKYYSLCFDARIQKCLVKSTVAELRAMNLTEVYLLELGYYSGIELHGYYTMGDTPSPIIYNLVDDNMQDDGGNVFVILGRTFVHKFLGAVEGLYFGVQNNDDESANLSAFRNWQKYVNENNGLYFQLTNPGGAFALFEPLYIRKSFIGINDPVLMYRADKVGAVVSTTAMTVDGKVSFNVKAVMGINPTDYKDSGERLEFRNFKIYCTSGDDDIVPAQDYGIYFPLGTSVKLENILVIRPNVAGFKFITLWMSELSRLNSWSSRHNGFELDGTFTSLLMSNCYAHGFKDRGFQITGAMYSTFSNLGADSGINALTAYSIGNVYGCTFQSLGSEQCTVDHLLYFADFYGSIANVFCLENSFKKDIFYGFQDSNVQISNVKLKDCQKLGPGPVNSFGFIDQLGGLGKDYFISYTDLKEKFMLGTYECPLSLMPKGTFKFITQEKTKVFVDGAWKEVVMS